MRTIKITNYYEADCILTVASDSTYPNRDRFVRISAFDSDVSIGTAFTDICVGKLQVHELIKALQAYLDYEGI